MDKDKNEVVPEEKKESDQAALEAKMDANQWLILDLDRAIDYQGALISRIDLTKLPEMSGRELNIIYDLYAAQGGGGVSMQESTLLFAQVAASRASGHPLEAIMEMKAKDCIRLKNRVYRFFFLTA